MYINGRVKILPLNCSESHYLNHELSRMTRIARIVEFVYQGTILKGCILLNRLLITNLLCRKVYPTHTYLNFQINNPRNPCHP